MVPQLALVDWVALVIAAVLLAAVVAALVIAWVASRHKRRSEHEASSRAKAQARTKGRTMVRRSTSDHATITDMLPQEEPMTNGEPASARPVPETRPNSLLDAPASAKIPVLANGIAGNGFALRQPGFFDDPIGRHEQRYWDGSRWTEYVKEEGQRFIDPL